MFQEFAVGLLQFLRAGLAPVNEFPFCRRFPALIECLRDPEDRKRKDVCQTEGRINETALPPLAFPNIVEDRTGNSDRTRLRIQIVTCHPFMSLFAVTIPLPKRRCPVENMPIEAEELPVSCCFRIAMICSSA